MVIHTFKLTLKRKTPTANTTKQKSVTEVESIPYISTIGFYFKKMNHEIRSCAVIPKPGISITPM